MQNSNLFARSCGDFPKLWAAETVSGFGSQVSGVALPLLAAVALDASPAQMGLLSAATTAPFLLIGLFAGVLVDRARRRTLLVAGPAAHALGRGPMMAVSTVLCGFFGLAIPLAVLFPEIALPMVLAAEFFQWLFLAAYRVGEASLRQEITPDHILGRVNATQRFMVYGAIPLGGLLGGVLGELAGVPLTLVVGMAGTLLASLWTLLPPARGVR